MSEQQPDHLPLGLQHSIPILTVHKHVTINHDTGEWRFRQEVKASYPLTDPDGKALKPLPPK